MNHLGLTSLQHKQLAALAVLVVDWNQKINLVSRKECTRDVVFGRHVLPSLAPLALKEMLQPEMRIVDVGTGGGFPGLPLAIAYPNCQFLLVDSVGKKLTAVKDMAETLKLTNVKIHHGRAELLEDDYDICVGRSVAALPSFCFWIQNLLGDKAKLLYLIGGELEENLLQEAKLDREIDVLLECPGASDKRVLVFDKAAIKRIAKTSGLKLPKNQKLSMGKPKKKRAKGEWMKRDNSVSKQRGYERLKRYNSISE